MKRRNCFPLALLFTLAFSACTLDEEPAVPVGATNKRIPVFSTATAIPDNTNNFQVKARLSSRGNLNILQHGWVWSETPKPTLRDSKLEMGSLTIDSFSAQIAGLSLGKPYYLRPFVCTGADTVYGPENCSFSGVNFAINTDTEIFQGADVQFTNATPANCTWLWNFGDGATSADASPLHTFNKLGAVTVRLIASTAGCSVEKTMTLQVIPDPFLDYWVEVPGGTFIMGCTAEQEPDCQPYEYPAHPVTLNSFFIGKTEVTQRQWLAVIGNNPSFYYDCGLDCPVETVSWDRIVNDFIPALTRKTGKIYSLPTEAQWEFAARGGNKSQGYKYAGGDDLNSVAWNDKNAGRTTHPAINRDANELGLYDMSGNVWEWCSDWIGYDYYSLSPSTDPPGPSTGVFRVLRGGSYLNIDSFYFRISYRFYYPPGKRTSEFGFRLVLH